MSFKQLTLEDDCAHLHYQKASWSYDWNENMVNCMDCPARVQISKVCRNAIDRTPIPI